MAAMPGLPDASVLPQPSPTTRTLRRLSRHAAGAIGALIVVLAIVLAIAAPLLAPSDPVKLAFNARFVPPTLSWSGLGAHPLGTDQLGRDSLSRILYGSRITLLISFSGVLVGGLVGVTVGTIAGFFGGWADRIAMRLADVQLAFPVLLLALIVVATVGPNLVTLITVLALTGWTRFARIVRAEVLSLRSREFVLSAEAAGAGVWRIALRHILPNITAAIMVVATLEMARLVLMESSLSFLGVGVQPPAPSLGRMLAEGRQYTESAWWLPTLPGIAIVLIVLGVSLLGDYLRDRYDPKLQGRR